MLEGAASAEEEEGKELPALTQLLEQTVTLSSSGKRVEYAALSPSDLSQRNMRRAKPLVSQNQPQWRSAEAGVLVKQLLSRLTRCLSLTVGDVER